MSAEAVARVRAACVRGRGGPGGYAYALGWLRGELESARREGRVLGDREIGGLLEIIDAAWTRESDGAAE